jgi:class 3 adenylate cyclase
MRSKAVITAIGTVAGLCLAGSAVAQQEQQAEDMEQQVSECREDLHALALQMQEAIARRATGLRLRIGLASGPVVAGVIGRRKFIYDLWGDTVNTASRMESHGQPGRIQVCDTTYEQLRDRYEFTGPHVIDVKGKGTLTTYYLEGPRR